LEATPFVAGEAVTITVTGGPSNGDVFLLFSALGQGAGPCLPQLGGECLGLLSPSLLTTLSADGDGVATWEVVLPETLPLDALHLQAVAFGPTELSPPLSASVYDHRVFLPETSTWRDSFVRPDSTDLGSPEFGPGTWYDPNPAGTTYASILGDEARLHYFAESPTVSDQWLSLQSTPVADGVMRAMLRTHPSYPRARLSWRLDAQNAGFHAAGYHLELDDDAITLLAGDWPLATATWTDDHQTHTWTVRFEGARQMVARDDEVIFDVWDTTYADGWVGLGASWGIAYLDGFSLADLGGLADLGWTATDSFDRADASVVDGWTESGDPTTPQVQVIDEALYLHYFVDGTSLPEQWATLDGTTARDFEMRVRLRGTTGGTNYMERGRPFGLSYRLAGDGGRSADGYHLHVHEEGVSLFSGGTLLVDGLMDVDNTWHELRVVVSGDRHRVWLDGRALLDHRDATWLDAGGVGVFASYSVATLDDVRLRPLVAPPLYPNHVPGELSTFPIGLYSVNAHRTAEVADRGFTFIQTYGDEESELATDAARYGLRTMSSVGTYHVDDAATPPNTTEAEALDNIADIRAHRTLGWWETPEEMRYWRANEVLELQNVYDWTRQHHPAPLYMYNPNHRSAADLATLAPYNDVIALGAYRGITQLPAADVRHKVQLAIEAIALAGADVGADYLAGDKIPGVALAAGDDGPGTEADAYHDVWAAIAEGARAIAIFGYFQGLADADTDTLRGYGRAAGQLTQGPVAMGPVVLYGTPVDAPFSVLDGPETCDPFVASSGPTVELPSLATRGWSFGGSRTVLVVNSSDEPVTAEIGGLGAAATATRLFGSGTLPVGDGAVVDTIEPLGVRLYRSSEW
jgi:hypothetical protein